MERKDFCIYKPNGKGTGGVAQFKMHRQDECMFLECASQVRPMDDPKPYNWDAKIIVKLGMVDIGKLLGYFALNAPQSALKLYHESPNGANKTIELKYQEYKGAPSYFLSISTKENKEASVQRVSLPVGLDEVELLKVCLKQAVRLMLAW